MASFPIIYDYRLWLSKNFSDKQKKVVVKIKRNVYSEIRLIEVNKVFAAVALTSTKIANWDVNKVNVDVGANCQLMIGARIPMILVYALRAKGGGYEVACICSGGVQVDAMLVKAE